MRRLMRMPAAASLLWAALPLLAMSESTTEQADPSGTKRVEAAQSSEDLERLRRAAAAFIALSSERREQLLKLDYDLHQQSSAAQAKLNAVMNRYAVWLAKLPQEDRDRIDQAPDKAARLAVIRELRDLDYMKQQPRALREKHAALTGPARAEFVAALRREEKKNRQDWRLAARFWRELDNKTPLDCRLSDMPKDVQSYVNDYLRMFLSREEIVRLTNAEGQWPGYLRTLVELADKHPPALPGADGPKTLGELPVELLVRLKLNKPVGGKKLQEGRWPGFATALARRAKTQNNTVLPFELWAYNYSCLSPQMKDFVDKKLQPSLTSDEKLRLLHAETDALWPAYPQTIHDLARARGLSPPWFTLPGLRERWEPYRMP